MIKDIDMNDEIAFNESMIKYLEKEGETYKARFLKILNDDLKKKKKEESK